MIPRIVHQAHLGKPMTKEVRAWVESVGRHHPGWSHIIWDETMLNGLDYDARDMKEQFGSWAAVTNILRLYLLNRFGGVWLDTDVEAIDTLERLPLDNYRAFAAEQDGGRICNAVMGADVGHQWIREQIMRSYRGEFPIKDPASGVYVATAAPREGLTIIPQHYVYPWMYDSPPEKRVPHADSILVHHWQGSWNK